MTDRDLKRLLSELSKLSLKSLKAGKKNLSLFSMMIFLCFLLWEILEAFFFFSLCYSENDLFGPLLELAEVWQLQERMQWSGPPAVYSWMAVTYCRTEKGDHHQNNVGQKKVLKKKQRCCWYWKKQPHNEIGTSTNLISQQKKRAGPK